MRIGIDLDGVVYQWTKTARYMLREILPNSPYTKDGPLGQECTEWDYIKHNVSPEHHKWLWNQGIELGLFRHGHLFPGSIKALRTLDRLGDLVAVTQRPERAVSDTYAWINFHQLPFREVHILHGGSKAAVRPCDAFIDDKPANCEELREAWPTALICMPDRPWNRDATPPGTVRVHTWDDFINLVRSKKNASAK